MAKTWNVVERREGDVELARFGQVLVVEPPADPFARLIYMRLVPGEKIDDGTVRLLTARKSVERENYMDWIVLRNNGNQAFLARGLEVTEVDRPKPMSVMEFRQLFAVDRSVDDMTVETVARFS